MNLNQIGQKLLLKKLVAERIRHILIIQQHFQTSLLLYPPSTLLGTSTHHSSHSKFINLLKPFQCHMQSLSQSPHFSFINESKSSSASVGTIEDCCGEFYMSCQSNHLVFVDSAANECHFGMATTTSGNISLTGTTWTVYMKEGAQSFLHKSLNWKQHNEISIFRFCHCKYWGHL